MADRSPMNVKTKIEADVKVGGITFPFEFLVVEDLGFDCIFGMDLLKDTDAAVKIKAGILELFGGLTTVPMCKMGSHNLVLTESVINIPPFSEAIVATVAKKKPEKGDYIIEAEFVARKASLLIARTLVDAT
jgi:hypothetical protein